MAGVRRSLIVVACVMVGILAHESDVGLSCASDVGVKSAQLGHLTCRSFVMARR